MPIQPFDIQRPFLSFLPQDRRAALAQGTSLPDRSVGTTLFTDLSGFTAMTRSLADGLGSRRGAEELSAYLARTYDALVREVDVRGGSVIGFSGDAITCWFDEDEGRWAPKPTRRVRRQRSRQRKSGSTRAAAHEPTSGP